MIIEEHVNSNSDGLKLEGILSYDENTFSPSLVLLCTPHPHLGGDMENNVTRMRTEYVLPLQSKITTRMEHLKEDKDHA